MAKSGVARLYVLNAEPQVQYVKSFTPKDRNRFMEDVQRLLTPACPDHLRLVVVEDPYYNRMNPKGYATSVAMVEILKYVLTREGYWVKSVNPMQARAAVGAPKIMRGKAYDIHKKQHLKKQQVRDGLDRIFGKETLDAALAEEPTISGREACCDALAIAYAGWILHTRT